MNKEEIIRLAKEADVWVAGQEPYQAQLERFAELVRADERDKWMERTAILIRGEREACAKVCEDLDAWNEDDPGGSAAKSIRARSNT